MLEPGRKLDHGQGTVVACGGVNVQDQIVVTVAVVVIEIHPRADLRGLGGVRNLVHEDNLELLGGTDDRLGIGVKAQENSVAHLGLLVVGGTAEEQREEERSSQVQTRHGRLTRMSPLGLVGAAAPLPPEELRAAAAALAATTDPTVV